MESASFNAVDGRMHKKATMMKATSRMATVALSSKPTPHVAPNAREKTMGANRCRPSSPRSFAVSGHAVSAHRIYSFPAKKAAMATKNMAAVSV